MPQGLTRFGSVYFAKPGISDVRLVCLYHPLLAEGRANAMLESANARSMVTARRVVRNRGFPRNKRMRTHVPPSGQLVHQSSRGLPTLETLCLGTPASLLLLCFVVEKPCSIEICPAGFLNLIKFDIMMAHSIAMATMSQVEGRSRTSARPTIRRWLLSTFLRHKS